ncbi:uncharacterized protein LOC102077425 isoform X1 [Oreochromis niloticus]|uniref:uncharacterized protein LOC102077425 isoform X1 n=1 Tax=Oreochromis niloticus TaxID=8128 RepID=UPI000DF19B0D|nr:uncharacterized protein LOC102077425 isoform X1 [Oreochromis niloticus]
MEAVLGLMVILLGVSHGTHTQSECETGQFQCKSGACIPIMWRCDGDDDCPDSSDEENCRTHTQSECETGQFQCKSGACIRILWRCDGDDDCPDSSDEENCRTHTQSECETGQFQCKSGACIPIMWRCDGDDDCPDSSDEENCLAGVETHFDRRQDGAQCYGALGGTVDIQLMDSTSEIPRYQLLKNSLRILDVRRNKVISNTLVHRSHFFPSNGTFRINNLRRNDSGNYTLQTFNSDGYSSGERTLQLFIQAPVSSVLLVSECLSQGERRVSCSSEGGGSPQYSWTLDGRTLTDAELLSGNNESNIITLKQHVSGRLVCSVRNNVSNVYKEQRISTCEAGILQVIGGVLLALVILLVVGIGIIFNQRKKQNYKPTKEKDGEDDRVELRAAVKLEAEVELEFEVEIESEDEDEGEGEGEAQAEKKVEVEYAQVKFPKQPRHTQPTGNNYLYATVRKMR